MSQGFGSDENGHITVEQRVGHILRGFHAVHGKSRILQGLGVESVADGHIVEEIAEGGRFRIGDDEQILLDFHSHTFIDDLFNADFDIVHFIFLS